MAAPTIIDMRLRPRTLHAFFGAEPGGRDDEVVRWMNRRVGSRDVDHFARADGIPGLVAEMDEAGVRLGLMVGRSVPGVRVDNDTLAAVARESGFRLRGVASVDPVALGSEAALDEARRGIAKLDLLGVNLDAGFYAEPMRADDDRLLPLYALCDELAVPAFVMSGPTTPDLAHNDPAAVDRVAKLFPRLPIVCCHGFYPHVAEMVAVAFRNENVFVSPDMYLFSPGGGLYVEAARGFMSDQLLFGSSYPFRPIGQGVEDARGLDLPPDILERVLHGNAERLFAGRL